MLIWDPDESEESEAEQYQGRWDDVDPEQQNEDICGYAAEDWAERRYSSDDYPDERTVCVKSDLDGKVYRFQVTTEQTVTFSAERIADE